MERLPCTPRPEWRRLVESQGLTFHTVDGFAYWDESAHYILDEDDAGAIETAANELHAMCLEAVEHLVSSDALDLVGVPRDMHGFVSESWRRREPGLYGRFDFSYDGEREPKLLEYNADTPTSLVESAVVQWYWMKDVFPELDQFNTIHERLVERWGEVGTGVSRAHHSCVYASDEDWMTINYLRDAALQAGIESVPIAVEDIGMNPSRRYFVDEQERDIELMFKLYPWEWLLREPFAAHLRSSRTRWIEPAWKTVLSNKALLVVLWSLFPESPYLLPASFEPLPGDVAVKPVHSREGNNIRLVRSGREILATAGPYDGPVVYQRLAPVRAFAGRYPTVCAWIVGDRMCGVGIREDVTPITRNTSSFIPHVYRP